MTSTGRLCHPVGFDGDEPRSRLLGRSIAPVLTGKLIQIQNSRPSITPTSNCSGNCRVSNIRRNSTLRSSFASRALFASRFGSAPGPKSQALRTKMEDVQATGVGFAQKQSSQRARHFRRKIFQRHPHSGRSWMLAEHKDRHAAPVITSTSDSFPSLLFKVNQEDW